LDDGANSQLKTFELSGAGFWTRSLVLVVSNRGKLGRIWFFNLDFLFRYTVILGILGAGGLGQVILSAVRVQDMQTVSAATLMIVTVVGVIEIIESRIGRSPAGRSQSR
jgi:ABC-type phosphate/phosphonate transport system permease subunit